MKYLLDTCVVSELVKARPMARVAGWIDAQDEEALFLSVVTIGELQKGISRLKDTTRKDMLQRWLDNDLSVRFSERILPICENVATTWGILQGSAEQKGLPMPTIDGLLAATALAHNMTLVTRNERDFVLAGVRLLNPWSTGEEGHINAGK